MLCYALQDAAWCVCKQDQPTTSQQKALDYACGAGADCNPILQNGACYNPNTVNAHCSYAVNSYYQRKGQAQGACDFAGAAGLVSSDPSRMLPFRNTLFFSVFLLFLINHGSIKPLHVWICSWWSLHLSCYPKVPSVSISFSLLLLNMFSFRNHSIFISLLSTL